MIYKTFLYYHRKWKNLGVVDHPNLFSYTCMPLSQIIYIIKIIILWCNTVVS